MECVTFGQSATKGVLQAVVDNLNNLSRDKLSEKDAKLKLDYHGSQPLWVNLRYEYSDYGRVLITTKGKNEMLTVLNALQNYLTDVEGKKF